MDGSIYVAGSRMSGLAAMLDVIAGNLANVGTPGHKRQVCDFEAVLQSAATAAAGPGTPGALQTYSPQLLPGRIDFSQGPLRMTGRRLDVAIRGTAFLVVDTPRGRRYTRRGRLYLNRQGELTDVLGNVFASEQRGALQIPADVARIEIASGGDVIADGARIGRLAMVEVPDLDLLVVEPGGLFRNDGRRARPTEESELVQGAIEESNANPVASLVALRQATRAYEAAARVLKRMNEASDQLVKSTA